MNHLLSLLACLTKRDPHAIIAIDVDADHPQHVSRAELWRRTLQLRADLATAGVGRGDAVLVCLPGWSHLLDWHIATASLGARVIAVDPADTTGPAGRVDLAHVLDRIRPKVAVAAHGDPAPSATSASADAEVADGASGTPGVSAASGTSVPATTLPVVLREALERTGAPAPTVAVVSGPFGRPPVDPSSYDVGAGAWLPSAATAGMPMPEVTGDEPAVAFGPRLAAHRESALTRHATATAEALDIRADDVVLCTRPPSDVVGLGTALATALAGGTCLLDPAPAAPRRVLGELGRFGATHLVTDEATAAAVAGERDPGFDAGDFPPEETHTPPWRHLGIVDSGPGTDATARRAAGAVGAVGVSVTVLFGTPDLLFPVTVAHAGTDTGADRSGADGSTAPTAHPVSAEVELRVVDPGSGEPVAPGTPGELRVRGHPVPCGLLLGAEESPADDATDGWWATGESAAPAPGGGVRHLGPVTADTGG